MSDVRLLGPIDSIRFEETSGECAEVRSLLATWWEQYSRGKPALFNGPILACRACEPSSGGEIRIAWYETDYAHYMQRVASNPIVTPAQAIFCSVALRSSSGGLLVGQMSRNTSSPRRLQLPGGNVMRGRSGTLSPESCAEDACREFQEEVGIALQSSQLELWRIKVGGRFDDVGIIYLCDLCMPEREIREAFDAQVRAERRAGMSPEFEGLVFVDADFFVRATTYEWVDYLPTVAHQLGQPPVRRRGS